VTTHVKIEALVKAIERRLAHISKEQHALAVQKAHLVEQLTPLRLGIVAPDTAVVQLRVKGITLRGLTAVRSVARRPRPASLTAVASIRPVVSLAR
jgi:hypothetical protein